MHSIKINVTFPADMLAKIDSRAAEESMTRSGLLQAAVREYLGRGMVVGDDAVCDLARAVLVAYGR